MPHPFDIALSALHDEHFNGTKDKVIWSHVPKYNEIDSSIAALEDKLKALKLPIEAWPIINELLNYQCELSVTIEQVAHQQGFQDGIKFLMAALYCKPSTEGVSL